MPTDKPPGLPSDNLLADLRLYIVKDGVVVPEPDHLAWARWFETADRVVAKTKVGEAEVSTVFLGLDHRHLGDGPPVLWETVVFGGPHDQWQKRYTSRERAQVGHAAAVEALRVGCEPE